MRMPRIGVGLAVVAFVVVAGALSSDPYAMDPRARLAPPSAEYWLGTDEQGRDVLGRLLLGTVVSVSVAAAATAVSSVLGLTLGLVAGYRGGTFDAVFGRAAEAVQAIPKLPLLLLFASVEPSAFGFSPGSASDLARIVVLFGLLGWVTMARVVRARAAQLREEPWVEAARGLGLSGFRVAVRHVIPHLRGPVRVTASLDLADAILLETSLSFLGLGVRPPMPSLGNLLSRGITYMTAAPWLLWAPGLVTVAWVVFFGWWAERSRSAQNPVADPVAPR